VRYNSNKYLLIKNKKVIFIIDTIDFLFLIITNVLSVSYVT